MQVDAAPSENDAASPKAKHFDAEVGRIAPTAAFPCVEQMHQRNEICGAKQATFTSQVRPPRQAPLWPR